MDATEWLAASSSQRLSRRLWWVALASPIVIAMAAPDRSVYWSYGIQTQSVLGDLEQYHTAVNAFSMLAVTSGVTLLLTARRLSFRLVALIAPWVFVACWLVGKRFILALLVFGILYVVWSRALLRGRRFTYALIAGVLCIGAISFVYQRSVRGMSEKEFDAYYSGIRLDFGRDAGIKQTILAELAGPDERILDFRGQSLLFDMTMFVPRDMWPEKPWPYAVYETTRALGLARVSSIGWGITTSWLDEAIANFSWLGFLIGPLALAAVCRLGDRTLDPVTRYLTVNVGALLMSVQLAAFWPLAGLWLVGCWRHYASNAARHVQHVIIPGSRRLGHADPRRSRVIVSPR